MPSPFRIVRKTNRHPESRGGNWGWYEIEPLEIAVGYWSDTGRDDLRDFELNLWNDEAKYLCTTPPSPAS